MTQLLNNDDDELVALTAALDTVEDDSCGGFNAATWLVPSLEMLGDKDLEKEFLTSTLSLLDMAEPDFTSIDQVELGDHPVILTGGSSSKQIRCSAGSVAMTPVHNHAAAAEWVPFESPSGREKEVFFGPVVSDLEVEAIARVELFLQRHQQQQQPPKTNSRSSNEQPQKTHQTKPPSQSRLRPPTQSKSVFNLATSTSNAPVAPNPMRIPLQASTTRTSDSIENQAPNKPPPATKALDSTKSVIKTYPVTKAPVTRATNKPATKTLPANAPPSSCFSRHTLEGINTNKPDLSPIPTHASSRPRVMNTPEKRALEATKTHSKWSPVRKAPVPEFAKYTTLTTHNRNKYLDTL